MKWFKDGLCFECTRCGNCCKGPGYVWVKDREIRAMAEHLDMDVDEFGRRFLKRYKGRLSLTEKGPEHRCILLGDDDRCMVYPVRPDQCKTFPFWPLPVKRREEWEALKEYCPGVDRGRLYTRDEIRDLMDTKRSPGA